jgi:2-polyprenyl-3-methyl-5-hydroxy-6-metoxy-1,4-benzoquinol methylase
MNASSTDFTQRGYQYGFSENGTAMYDVTGRERKAHTMLAVLRDHFGGDLDNLSALNIGGSTGIIDSVLAMHFQYVNSIDIDEKAITYAQQQFSTPNLQFAVGDAMNLCQADNTFNVVICSQVYEHVPDSAQMMREIYRVLKPGGVCYFAAGNRLMWNEPHYNLPLLSVIPRSIAHRYLRLTNKGNFYYEKHLTYWGLKNLVSHFKCHDYTTKMLASPAQFGIEYMVNPNHFNSKLAKSLAKYCLWSIPGYIWILEK